MAKSVILTVNMKIRALPLLASRSCTSFRDDGVGALGRIPQADGVGKDQQRQRSSEG